MAKVKMKLLYHIIIEKHAAKANREFFQLKRNLSGKMRPKKTSIKKKLNDFNHFFATISENLNKKLRQFEYSLKNQQIQSMFLLPTSKKEVLRVIQEAKKNTEKNIWIFTTSL